ncbi:MAG: recombinase RecT [Actinomycetota bacterium]|nr:recombinase RecT [Actinomycetota bacterium]
MSTELTTTNGDNDLSAQIEFARMVTVQPERAAGIGQSILPESYRGNPANVLVAVGLGRAMGLSYAESLYRISVIKGKPSAAAELIASNVRKAGHKLRIKVTEQPPSATCTIIRADDPDEPTTISRDMAWATRMGLANEPNYKKQPATMLSYRAITACARLACPEALYGVTYTPDEAYDLPPETPVQRVTAADFGAAPVADVTDAEEVHDTPEAVAEERADTQPVEPMTARTRGHMFALFNELNISADDQRAGIALIVGHPIESRGDLTETEAQQVVNRLKVKKAEQDAGAEPVEPGLFEGGA